MKKESRRPIKIVIYFLRSILAVLIIMVSYHHIRLAIDKPEIKSIGTLVEIKGYHMNIYIESRKEIQDNPAIVLLSGSGVSSPIYDYKVLYSKLADDYKVAVVEKFGYGYSDISGISRDVAVMVEESREALAKAGESAPYVLMPHSMSALEAIYWAYTYPEEVHAVIGLDMAVPESYDKDNIASITLMKMGAFFGFHRFEMFNPISNMGLTKEEYEQNRLLNYKNALNKDVYNECKMVLKNADTVKDMEISDIPMLMFTTNLGSGGDEIWSSDWVMAQENFAEKFDNCVQIEYDCGHNLHYYKSGEMAETILHFLNSLN